MTTLNLKFRVIGPVNRKLGKIILLVEPLVKKEIGEFKEVIIEYQYSRQLRRYTVKEGDEIELKVKGGRFKRENGTLEIKNGY